MNIFQQQFSIIDPITESLYLIVGNKGVIKSYSPFHDVIVFLLHDRVASKQDLKTGRRDIKHIIIA